MSHDLSLFVSPGDAVAHLGGIAWTDRAGRQAMAEFYLVVHRRLGEWTHLYWLIEGARPDHFQLILERAEEGEVGAELSAWFEELSPPRLQVRRSRAREMK